MGELCVYQDDQTLTSIPGGLIRDIPRVGNDVRRLHLTGSFAPWQQFNGNFVESRIYDAEFRNVDLTRCDWKDCRVIGVVFENCKLGHASFITNSFEGCEFVSCQFPDTGISDCVFKSCIFNACDFTDVIIKSSHIEKTDFIDCKTSNRVVESSLLIDTHWKSMAVDARLIFGNFGLLRSELEQCALVVRNPDGSVLEHDWTNLGQVASKSDLSPIEYLRYRNFETEDLESDEDVLEAALDWKNWKGDVSVQASFGAQLSSFAKFLIALFERDRLPVYPLLILHARNFDALSQLEGRADLMDLRGQDWLHSRSLTHC